MRATSAWRNRTVKPGMHEYPITVQIIGIAEKSCREAGAVRVTKISLVIGESSGFIGESISMYFDIIAEGTLCAGAALEIERVKAKLQCPACGEIFTRAPLSFACPCCGQDGGPTQIGKEFYVKAIEVEGEAAEESDIGKTSA